ncbi:MAG: hypothetical protein Q7S04_02950 [Candidatus Moranbacteria bacterium]|nr:hypothetical protein [Candidatus Moranbacteria bacterium]
MDNNQNRESLSQVKVKEVASRYISGCDKWYRMYAGIASNLERYESGIMYLRIENTEKTKPSSYETAVEFARKWVGYNAELKDAKGFVVSFYTSGATGFVLNGATDKGIASDLVQQFIRASQQEKKLVNIFSGELKV